MAGIIIVYWSGTGNTERMAELIAEGATAGGAEAVRKAVSQTTVAEALKYDAIALGSPSMGTEVIEEGEMEPFVAELEKSVEGRTLALFGSYDWGDGEWMRNWADRMKGQGAKLLDEQGLAVHLTPGGEDEEHCRDLGRRLAKAILKA
ncbi:MAG: flavodoxin [Planctomycetota bacterium]|jgi:flavodoxin short chain|nr:flavodoxin [Planctomycetota bacterium]